MTAVTSVRSNSMPAGGAAATQPVPPNMTPQDIAALVEQLTPTVARFRQQSSPMSVALNQDVLVTGQQDSVRIASVGLGVRTISEHSVVITLQNTAATAQVVSLSPLFPYNLLANTQVQVNGGATVYSASGIAGLAAALRNRAGTFRLSTDGGFGPALSPALVRVTVASATVTNATAPTFSGIASISIAATTTATVTVTFYTVEKLALDRESLLGALPLQNNSTYATLTRQMASQLVGASGTQATPFSTSGAVPGTLVPNMTDTVQTSYEFWSVPGDPSLYQEMVQNSFQVQEQTSLTVNATGPAALQYDVPQNQYLVAAHLWAFDSNGIAVPGSSLQKLVLQYNAGGVTPVVQFAGRVRAAQFVDYADDRQLFAGYRFWDGEDTTEDVTDADQAGWVDTYAAATPQLIADLATSVVTPMKFSLTRESVVAGAVQVIGG